MAIFSEDEASWQRVDYAAIMGHGLMSLSEPDVEAGRAWLTERRYLLRTVDCAAGFTAVCARLSALFRWKEQFGYEYQGRSLDALSDGFRFEVPDEGGLVLELSRPDVLWKEQPRWLIGLLDIASEHSRFHLAAGRRFFTLLVLPSDSALLGERAFEVTVPGCWSLPGAQPPFRPVP